MDRLDKYNMLKEERYDKYDGKAIFVIGPPASGKSTFIKRSIDNLNFKLADSDTIFEKLMSKHNLSLKMDSLTYKNKDKKEELLDKAYSLNVRRLAMMIKKRIPLIVVRTGRNMHAILRTKSMMDEMGYDCFLVLIEASQKETAIRNKERYRTVDKDFMKRSNIGYIKNKKEYKKRFKNYLEIDTTGGLSEEDFVKYGVEIEKWAGKK